MSAYKLFKLIGTLHPEELGEIGRYLDSSVFNTNPRCSQLFQQLCKFHPTMNSGKLTKERLFAKVFGKSPYDDGKMRKLMTQLSQLVERYLVIKMLDKSEDVHKQLLIKSLGERNDYELFRAAAENRIMELERQQQRGKDYFREKHLLNEMLYYHPETEKLTKGNDYLRRAVLSFEQYFTLLSLENAADIMVVNRIVDTEIQMKYLDSINQVSLEADFANESAIQFFHTLINLNSKEQEEGLENIRNLTFKAHNLLSSAEKSHAINAMRNYAMPIANRGSLLHSKFVFDLFKLEIQNGFLASGSKRINSATFMNIVSVGLVVKEMAWTNEFILNYSKLIQEDEMEITLNFCKGLWYYHQGMITNDVECFNSAVNLLTLVPGRSGAKFELRIRPTLLRVYYELLRRQKETLEHVLQHVRNFERHLTFKDVYSKDIQLTYKNFIKHYRTLAKFSDKVTNPVSDEPKLKKFMDTLGTAQDVVLKRWLLEKAEELLAQLSPNSSRPGVSSDYPL